MTIAEVQKLADALEAARSLSEPGEINAEYVRGQAELICDLFGLGMDCKEDVINLITGKTPVGDFDLGALS